MYIHTWMYILYINTVLTLTHEGIRQYVYVYTYAVLTFYETIS